MAQKTGTMKYFGIRFHSETWALSYHPIVKVIPLMVFKFLRESRLLFDLNSKFYPRLVYLWFASDMLFLLLFLLQRQLLKRLPRC